MASHPGDSLGDSPWRAAWRRFLASRSGVHGLGALAAVCAGGLLEPLLTGPRPGHHRAGELAVAALDAAGASLLLGLAGALAAALLALAWGGGAALAGGRAERWLLTLAGVAGALPLPLLPLAVGGVLAPGMGGFALALGVAAAPGLAVMVHGVVRRLVRSDAVAAGRSGGHEPLAILFHRIMPAAVLPLLAVCWGAWPRALAMEGFAGLLNLGPAAGADTWGALLGDAVAAGGAAGLLGPGLLLGITLWALGAIGEGLAAAALPAMDGAWR